MRPRRARDAQPMKLRTPGTHRVRRHPRLPGVRLVAPCCAPGRPAARPLFAGSSGAGVAQYTGTLYLDGSGSRRSRQAASRSRPPFPALKAPLPPPSQGRRTAAAFRPAPYKYIYVTTSGAARTASVASNQVSVTNAPVTVTNVPVGADVYRSKIPSGTNTGTYILLGSNPGPTAAYTDTSTATTGTLLPEADNRVAMSATGWAPFAPGVSLASSTVANTPTTVPSIGSSCAGWIVDAPGGRQLRGGDVDLLRAGTAGLEPQRRRRADRGDVEGRRQRQHCRRLAPSCRLPTGAPSPSTG